MTNFDRIKGHKNETQLPYFWRILLFNYFSESVNCQFHIIFLQICGIILFNKQFAVYWKRKLPLGLIAHYLIHTGPEGCLIVRKISFPFVNLSETPVVRRDEESDFLYTKVNEIYKGEDRLIALNFTWT